MTDDDDRELRWGVLRRLEFIDFRLFWDGFFNRKDLVDFFGISAQQASADISHYQERASKNLTYDRTRKTYVRTEEYEPALIGPYSDRFLLQLTAIESGWMRQEDTWFAAMPPIEVVSSLRRRATNPHHLLSVLDAIKRNAEIEIQYESLTGTPPGIRKIAPHSMLHAGGRWYVRAWSRDHNDFRDYNLNRIKGVGTQQLCSIDPKLDLEWHHTIDLILIPNPGLERAIQDAVAAEYEMTNDQLVVSSRLSVAFYLINEHNLDVPAGTLKPEKQQLVLENVEDVIQARAVARKLSVEALRKAVNP
nr:WYL domain-containing protein [Ensifer sp. WSM1721]